MRNTTVGIGADMLTPAVYERFSSIFNVAARKSLLTWKEVSSAQAEVMVVDASYANSGIRYSAPCVVYLGHEPADMLAGRPWVSRLKLNYTVSDLIDVLDRAAVFLDDWRVRHGGAQRASESAAASAAMTQRAVAASDVAYQLTRWVALSAPYNTASHTKALALLTSQPVSIKQLCAHADISVDDLSRLLVQLAEMGVLKQINLAPAKTGAVQSSSSAPPNRPVVSHGLIQRFSRWIRGESRK